MDPRHTLKYLIKSVDAQGIELARGEVRPEDVPRLCAWYWTLERWDQKLAVIELIQDQYHPSMDKVCLDALRAPGDGADWVDLPKIIALGIVSKEHDNFALFYNDRAALGAAVDEVLAARGLERAREPAARRPTSPPDAPPARDLIAALMSGDEAGAIALLEGGADPNTRRDNEPDGQPALWWAAANGMPVAVEALLARGAEVDATDKWQSTPLVRAATAGHAEVVDRLLAAGADPRARIGDGRSALNMSVRSGNAAIMAALLDAGADLQSPQPTFTPLAFACFEGTTAQVKLLLERGADPDRRITYGNFRDVTPLMLAANAGKPKMVEALLAAGADPELRDDGGKSAADWARGKLADEIRALLAR